MGQSTGNQLFIMSKIEKSAQEWRELLARKNAEPLAYQVTREASGTASSLVPQDKKRDPPTRRWVPFTSGTKIPDLLALK